MSPFEFQECHLLSDYFSFTYPLDLLASARHAPYQSDSHMSLQFGVQYLLISFQHCSLFPPVGSMWILYLLSTRYLFFNFLIIETFSLIRFEMFFSCWKNSVLDIFLINSVKRFYFSSLSLSFSSAILSNFRNLWGCLCDNCLILYLTGVHFRGELQHPGDASGQKIKCCPIRTREIGGVRL